jgi:hypothetical protein
VKGQLLGRGVADNADCPGIPYELVMPDRSVENVVTLTRNLNQWRQREQQFYDLRNRGETTDDVVKRAHFAVNVMETVKMNVEMGICCEVVAIDPDGDILGTLIYMIHGPGTMKVGPLMMSGTYQTNFAPVAFINLLAIDPVNVPGSPFTVQLRGVGTALVAAAAQRVLKQGIEYIYLHPLDDAAQAFWVRRGFRLVSGSLYVVDGVLSIKKLIDACKTDPENCVDGDFLFCGVHPKVREHILSKRR